MQASAWSPDPQCGVCSCPSPPAQVRWTKTAGSASDKFQETSVFNETLRIERIARTQGGRYYCKAENGVGVPAIKSIRVDVQCELAPSRLSWPRPVHPGFRRPLQGLRLGKEEWGWKTVDTSSRPC